jgi:3-methyladenine DNA glycosylase AlkD
MGGAAERACRRVGCVTDAPNDAPSGAPSGAPTDPPFAPTDPPFDAIAQARSLLHLLRAAGTPERAIAEQAYLKSDLEFSGTTVPALRAVLVQWRKDWPHLTHDDLTTLIRALWASPVYECRQSAVILLERSTRMLRSDDIGLLEDLLRTSHTWALVDGLAANVVGDLVQRFPALNTTLDRWAADEDFWIRRSALLALLVPLRRGTDDSDGGSGGDFPRFARYADQMLDEREFFIRKAIGWVLRETAKRRPDLVAAWLAPRLHRASGVTVREAVKPLPASLRDQLMAGYRDRQPVTLA